MASHLLISSLLILCLAEACYGTVLFSSLKRTLLLQVTPKPGDVLKAGEDKITVTWSMNQSFPVGTDEAYKTVKVKLCFAPISQVDRAWRKTKAELKKDKTCQFKIFVGSYELSSKKTQQSFDYSIAKNVPTATFFVRIYAYNAEDHEVAFGQTTDATKKTNLFTIESITGRHTSIDIAAGCFSAFSIFALLGFFIAEKRRGRNSQKN
ncbi:hypothetical protein GIB67_030950 [Kingdonia uniflora]|uniref:High-affinity nitrate transporter n=1 Tax=Kingdonia uniflora TaxID=39325 RepID=A0A7J7L3I5_9MAGN|nr:hypothetical protein GIB67_030950 [Kingdonia uniflora]